jgi:hypothetical protein
MNLKEKEMINTTENEENGSSPCFRSIEEKKSEFDNLVVASVMGFQEEKSKVNFNEYFSGSNIEKL